MLTQTEEKKQYLNQYWQTRHLPSADTRSDQRAELVESLLGGPRSKKFLDVGCGRGVVMAHLTGLGYKVDGCDLATEVVYALRCRGYDVFVFDIEKDDLLKNYDGILCLEVLQQLFDPILALKKFAKAVKNGGGLIVSVPNEFHIWSRLRLLMGTSHLGHFDESHIRLFSPKRARLLFERAGLQIEKAVPVSLIPPGIMGFGWLGKFLARMIPSLFSLSQIYRLKTK